MAEVWLKFSTGVSGLAFDRLCSFESPARHLMSLRAGGRGAKPVGRSGVAAGRDVRDPLQGVGGGGMTHQPDRICLPPSTDAVVTS
jgi:hypothetical protein